MPPLPVAFGGVRPERIRLIAHAGQLDDQGGIGQVVEQGGGPLEEQGQPVLDSGRGEALAHVAVYRAGVRVAFEAGAPSGAEAADRFRVERKLAGGEQADRAGPVERALGLGVERADRLDLGVEEIDAVGVLRAGGEEVEERAAYRELAVLHDLAHAAVAAELQPAPRRVEVQPVADGEKEAVSFHEAPRGEPPHEGGGGDHEDPAACAGQRVQGGEAFRDDVLVRGDGVVGQGLPVREVEQRQRLGRGRRCGGCGCCGCGRRSGCRPRGGAPRPRGVVGAFPPAAPDRPARGKGSGIGIEAAAVREEGDLGAQRVRGRRIGGDDEGEAGKRTGGRRDGERTAGALQPFPVAAVPGAARQHGPEWTRSLHGSSLALRRGRLRRSAANSIRERSWERGRPARTFRSWVLHAFAGGAPYINILPTAHMPRLRYDREPAGAKSARSGFTSVRRTSVAPGRRTAAAAA